MRDGKEVIVRNTGISNAEWQQVDQLQDTVNHKQKNIDNFNELLRATQPILCTTVRKLQETSQTE